MNQIPLSSNDHINYNCFKQPTIKILLNQIQFKIMITKRLLILFIALHLCIYASSQEYAKISMKSISFGLSNHFFRYNKENFSSFSPTVEFKLSKHTSVVSQYERFKHQEIVDISNVRDGQPRVISNKSTYQHIPLSIKYSFINRKTGLYIKISGINQFKKNLTTKFIFNNPLEISSQNEFNILYGFSVGVYSNICQNKINLETYLKDGKNINSKIIGLNLNYMFNLTKNHEN